MKLWVPGQPVPQGATTSFVPKGGKRPITKYTNESSLYRWRADVRAAAENWNRAAGNVATPPDLPASVTIYIVLPRPKSHFRTGRNAGVLKELAPPYPTGKNSGDADKFARAILDALQGIAYGDDSQVVELGVRKFWAGSKGPGAEIEIAWFTWGEN